MRTHILSLFAACAAVPVGLMAMAPQNALAGGFGSGGIAAASAYGILNQPGYAPPPPRVYEQRPIVVETPMRRHHHESRTVMARHPAAPSKAAPSRTEPTLPTAATEQAEASTRTAIPSPASPAPRIQSQDTVEPAAMGAY